MPKFRSPINTFNGGEISRRMEGRSDLDGIWDRALEKMLNYVATVEGPATKRPGFEFIQQGAPTAAWLSTFIFNSTQAYVLEWSEKKLRFFTNGGRIDQSGQPYELPVPYHAFETPRISTKQSFDRLYMAHGSYAPAMLTRTSAETFNYSPIPLKNGPFKDWNTDTTKRVSWSGSGAVGAVATLTSTTPIFQAGHVGAPFIIQVESYADVMAWEPDVATTVQDAASKVTVGCFVKSDGKVYQCLDLGGSHYTGTVEPTHTAGAEWDGAGGTPIGQPNGSLAGVKWQYVHDRYGIGTITAVTSPTQATVTVARALPTLSPDTHFWAHSCFSNVEGWPQLVGTWGGRLVFLKGIDLIASVVGDYWNMSPVNDDGVFSPDMAFRLTLNVNDPPNWMYNDASGYLLLGSHSEEIMVSQVNRAAGISATNLSADPQSSYGSADVFPVKIGLSILFVQKGSRKVREAQFDYYRGRFVAQHANVYSRQITAPGIAWWAFQQEPENILWGGLNDGTLFAHPHDPEQEIKGFSRVALGQGTILSGVSIPSDDGTLDDLWVLASLDGANGVLKLSKFWDEDAGLTQADAFFVDWGVSYDGTHAGINGVDLPKQTFTTGLSHLEGRQVRVLYDGAETNLLTVKNGSITLPKPAVKVKIGLGYQARLKLLRAEARGAPSTQGMRQRVSRLFARLIDTAQLSVLNRLGESVSLFKRSAPMGSPPALFNGDTPNVAIGGGGSDHNDQPEIISDDALPSIVTLLVPTYALEDAPGD